MPAILKFSRNRSTSVEALDDHTLRSTCRLQDTLTDAWVEITVGLPELEITGARGRFPWTVERSCANLDKAFQKILGVRIGAGLIKIVKGLVSEVTDCGQIAFMIEECCHGVILAFTKDQILKTPEGYEATAQDYRQMVRDNIRLYNRCAAFAPGSPPLVKGIEPP